MDARNEKKVTFKGLESKEKPRNMEFEALKLRRTLSSHHIAIAAEMLAASDDLEIQAGWHHDFTEWWIIRSSLGDLDINNYTVRTISYDNVHECTVAEYIGYELPIETEEQSLI